MYGIAGIYFLALLCLWKSIAVSVAVLQTASLIIIRNIRVLIVPFVAAIFIFAFVGSWLVGFGHLLSCAHIIQPDNGSQLKTIDLEGKEELKWQIASYVFGLFWIAEFLSAFFQYVIIVGVCTWYFSSSEMQAGNLALSKGVYWALRYNFGSLAFGSFLLAIIWTIRLVFEYVNKKIKDLNGDNAAVKCISNMIRCCLDCCHRFVKFLNENAYIQVALTGENFCQSAMAGFVLALKHSSSFVITNGIGSMIGFIGKITIATGNTFIGYLLIT